MEQGKRKDMFTDRPVLFDSGIVRYDKMGQRLNLDTNIKTKYVYVRKHTNTARIVSH